MVANLDKRDATRSRRRLGNVHERVEEARKRRAEVLATPKPANDSKPAPVKKPELKVAPDLPRKELLPTIRPQPAIVKPEPARKSDKIAIWHLGIVTVILGLLAYAYFAPLEDLPSVQERTALLPAPAATIQATILPVDTAPQRPSVPSRIPSPDGASLPTIQSVSLAPVPEFSPNAPSFLTDTMAPPKARADVLRAEPARAPEPTPLPVAPDAETLATGDLRSLTNLRIALNVPASTPPAALATLVDNANAAGLNIGEPRIVNFPIKSTQVRYFHRSDEESARLLADTIGGVARDFTNFDPPPAVGLVEIWVSGRARETDAGSGSRAIEALGRDMRQFSSNLRDKLQSISR